MKTTVDKLSDTRVKLTVNVPFAELDKEIDQAYSAIAQQVQIPGFRKGKAPRQLIDARFGRGAMLEQVVNDMLPSRYEQAVTENDLKVIGQPNIDIPKVETTTSLSSQLRLMFAQRSKFQTSPRSPSPSQHLLSPTKTLKRNSKNSQAASVSSRTPSAS